LLINTNFSCKDYKKTMARKRKVPYSIPKGQGQVTLLEQKPSIYNAIVEGVKKGLSYADVAKACGVSAITLSKWLARAREVEQEMEKLGLTCDEIDELSGSVEEIEREKDRWISKYGKGVITVVVDRGLWLKLGHDLRKADGWAEARMLGVIQGAAIGGQSVTERKVRSVQLKVSDGNGESQFVPAEEVTTVTRQLKPQWQAAAWFLERKYPEKYSQKKVIEGQLPPDIPYEVFMTAKTLLQLPKVELERVVTALKQRVQHPKIASAPVGLIEGGRNA
jgi:hypothetical protein